MSQWLAYALAPFSLFSAVPATASAVVIWPIDPTIKAGEQATALWLENKGDTAVTMQVRTFAWSQRSGDEALDSQDAIVASPPIARIEPGARQLIRIIRRTSGSAPESAYRLIVDELPPPPPDGSQQPQARLAVQMRYSVPLFTYTEAQAQPAQLIAKVQTTVNGRSLTLTNTGSTHARLTDLRLVSGTQQTVVRSGLAGYVLPGATITIPIPAGAGTLHVGVNGADQALLSNA